VVIKDLIHSLKTKKIKGACLDVLELENKDFSIDKSKNKLFEELIKFENVIFTPHIAGWTHESKEEMGRVIINKIKQKFFSN
jgi:D-3-phosphoglycerate dehydrogenase